MSGRSSRGGGLRLVAGQRLGQRDRRSAVCGGDVGQLDHRTRRSAGLGGTARSQDGVTADIDGFVHFVERQLGERCVLVASAGGRRQVAEA